MTGFYDDHGGSLFSSGNGNHGSGNRYWIGTGEPSGDRFQWTGPRTTLSSYNGTPGDEGATYLTNGQRDSAPVRRTGSPTGGTSTVPPRLRRRRIRRLRRRQPEPGPRARSGAGAVGPQAGGQQAGLLAAHRSPRDERHGPGAARLEPPRTAPTATSCSSSGSAVSTSPSRCRAPRHAPSRSCCSSGRTTGRASGSRSMDVERLGDEPDRRGRPVPGDQLPDHLGRRLEAHGQRHRVRRPPAGHQRGRCQGCASRSRVVRSRGSRRRARARGSAEVWVDGDLRTTVSLRRSTSLARAVVFTASWSSSGEHTVEIRTLGTDGHPRVDVDAFIVLR